MYGTQKGFKGMFTRESENVRIRVTCNFKTERFLDVTHRQSHTLHTNNNISETVQHRAVVTQTTNSIYYVYLTNKDLCIWPIQKRQIHMTFFKVIHPLQAFSNVIFRTAVLQLTIFRLSQRVARSLCNNLYYTIRYDVSTCTQKLAIWSAQSSARHRNKKLSKASCTCYCSKRIIMGAEDRWCQDGN